MHTSFSDSAVLGKYHGETVGVTMSRRSELDHDLQTVRAIMGEPEPDPVLTAEQQLGRKIDWLVRQMDELCALANNPETRDMIEKEALGVGQIRFRASLVLDFLDADKPRLTVVSNRGVNA